MMLCLLIWLKPVNVSAQEMDNARLEQILTSVTDSLEGHSGVWQLEYNDRVMLVITDEVHDRMRIITPVKSMEETTAGELESAMIANFHSVLDARYAVSEDILWAAFIHPFRELSEQSVRDALLQVFRAAETFGTTYSSTDLVFPGTGEDMDLSDQEKRKM